MNIFRTATASLILTCLLASCFTGSTPPPSPSIATDKKTYFDSIQFNPLTSTSRIGHGWVICQTTNGTISGATDEANTKAAIRTFRLQGITCIALDLEDLQLDSRYATSDQVRANCAKVTTIIGWCRNAGPGMKFGVFGFPSAFPPYAITNLQVGADSWDAYRASGDLAAPLIPVDFSCPECYSRTTYDATGLILSADRNWIVMSCAECKRLYPTKPVYPFLCTEYVVGGDNLHIGEGLPSKPMEGLLRTAWDYGDGAILWGGWGLNGRKDWPSDSEPWLVGARAAGN